MHVTDPSAILGSLMVFLLGAGTLISGRKAKILEMQRQLKQDEAQKKKDEAEREDRAANTEENRADKFRADSEFWENRYQRTQAELDTLRALHISMLGEWIELGTTRLEQLDLARYAYKLRAEHNARGDSRLSPGENAPVRNKDGTPQIGGE